MSLPSLRIAVTADPFLPVPPLLYGGIERIIHLLVEELARRGHQVTLFAHPDSSLSGRLVPFPRNANGSILRLASTICGLTARALRDEFELIHNFGRLAYMGALMPLRIPKLMSYQREITLRSVLWGSAASGGTLHFSGCSQRLIHDYAHDPHWHVVYNGVSEQFYRFSDHVESDAPLVFLGRMERIKGPHLAIEIARKAGRKLILAGNVPDEAEHKEFAEREILPHVDGESIAYIGPLDDARKNEILGRAAALLFPILWEEPFGIVMAESLACGTPVIGLARGSVPEVIENGRTGFVCHTVDEMVDCISQLPTIDRMWCREAMENRFSTTAMTDRYESIYRDMLNGSTNA